MMHYTHNLLIMQISIGFYFPKQKISPLQCQNYCGASRYVYVILVLRFLHRRPVCLSFLYRSTILWVLGFFSFGKYICLFSFL